MFCGALLEQIIKERGLTAYRLSKIIGCSQSSIANWISGKNTPNYQKISALADALNVSVDYLLGNEEKPALEDKDGLTARDHRDIARDLERIMSDIESSETLMFDGDPATEGARETLRNAIAMGLEYAKKVNKETYTPKKYRKSKE